MDFYEVLKVPKDADTAAIEKAFKKLSLTLHPDKANARTVPRGREESGPERTAREKLNHDRFVEIGEARDTLTDPKKRRAYDKERSRSKASAGTRAKTQSYPSASTGPRDRSGKAYSPSQGPRTRYTTREKPGPSGRRPEGYTSFRSSRGTSARGTSSRQESFGEEGYGREGYGREGYRRGGYERESYGRNGVRDSYSYRHVKSEQARYGAEASTSSHTASHQRTEDYLKALAKELRYERLLEDRLLRMLDLIRSQSPLQSDPEFFDVISQFEAQRVKNKRAGRVILTAEMDISTVVGSTPEADSKRRLTFRAAMEIIQRHIEDMEELVFELELVVTPDRVWRDHFLFARIRQVFALFEDEDG
ncbi:DnaJ domain-containing protein [Nemania serpens]|nr:DnaJ domain-containing protein [Nemania serpens]